ncbi:MAG: hypothetical protein AAF483_31000 [Planctomycetota bacterium]
MAELMFAEDVSLDKKELVTRTNALIDSGAQIWEGEENAEEFAKENRKSDLVLIAHSKLLCEFKDATLPSQTAIMFARREGEAPGEEEIVQQSWSCDNAEEILAATKSTFLITEMMSQVLEPQERLRAFHGVLQAAVELSQPIGIRFIHSCQIVASKDYLASCDYSPIERVGSFNVRFYRIENNDGEMLMDTRGLDEIGIPGRCMFKTTSCTSWTPVMVRIGRCRG